AGIYPLSLHDALPILEQQGMTGRHQPFGGGGEETAPATEEPETDPRYAPAEDALMAGDLDRAIAEYDKLLGETPGDAEASAGKRSEEHTSELQSRENL